MRTTPFVAARHAIDLHVPNQSKLGDSLLKVLFSSQISPIRIADMPSIGAKFL